MTTYIAIEGSDKVGKATQTELLVNALNAMQPPPRRQYIAPWARSVEIPFKDGATYDLIYAMLKDGRAKEAPGLFQTLHVANRAVWEAQNVNPNQKYIIFDRWNASTVVYGRMAGLSDTFIAALLTGVRTTVDLTFVLDGKPMASAEDTYEANTEFMRKVRGGYLNWAVGRAHTLVFNANRPREVVHEDIMSVVRARFTS